MDASPGRDEVSTAQLTDGGCVGAGSKLLRLGQRWFCRELTWAWTDGLFPTGREQYKGMWTSVGADTVSLSRLKPSMGGE